MIAVQFWALQGQVGQQVSLAATDIQELERQRQLFDRGGSAGSSAQTFGGCILYHGFRFEYGYDWMNSVPPQGGDLFNLNFFLNAGVRF